MTEYNTISTEDWQIKLPTDWEQKPNENSIYFEAADGTKGAYLSVWRRDDPSTPQLAALAEFRTQEIQGLHQMEDHQWEILDEWEHESGGAATSGSDCLARKQRYRIVCLGMTSASWLVRVSLHDYDCADYPVSKAYFEPIIQSLNVVSPTLEA